MCLLAAGEAVALLFGGVPLAPSVALRTHFGGLAGALPGASPTSTSSVTTSSSSTTPSGSAPQPMEVEAPQWQQWWRPDSAARGQVQAALLTQLLDMAIHSKVEVRPSPLLALPPAAGAQLRLAHAGGLNPPCACACGVGTPLLSCRSRRCAARQPCGW